MQAIVCLGNGAYYLSKVFGYYKKVDSDDDYQRYIQSIYSQYYIVLDEEKKKLVRHYAYDLSKRPQMHLRILLIDDSTEDWIINKDGTGCVDFLLRKDIEVMSDYDSFPSDTINRCVDMDAQYHYEEYKVIENETDAENFLLAVGDFHDARIDKLEEQKDGSLYVMVTDVWGCSVELWFSGDVEYSASSRTSEEYDPYWMSSSILFKNGFTYFIDDVDVVVEDLGDEYCWFKAREMKYHIIPD